TRPVGEGRAADRCLDRGGHRPTGWAPGGLGTGGAASTQPGRSGALCPCCSARRARCEREKSLGVLTAVGTEPQMCGNLGLGAVSVVSDARQLCPVREAVETAAATEVSSVIADQSGSVHSHDRTSP